VKVEETSRLWLTPIEGLEAGRELLDQISDLTELSQKLLARWMKALARSKTKLALYKLIFTINFKTVFRTCGYFPDPKSYIEYLKVLGFMQFTQDDAHD
jgi:hypothetical protein